jgi:thioredoxin reductase
MKQNEITIIGAGPAGIACAIQLKRFGFKPLLFERDMPGGLLRNANKIENYPGFPEGISGQNLCEKLSRHLKMAGVETIREEVINIDFQDEVFLISTKADRYTSPLLVIASGTSPIEFPISSIGNQDRLLYEIYPIRDIRSKSIAIIGAGDAAFDYSLHLSKNNNKVEIFNRHSRVKCLPVLFEKAANEPGVSYHENHILEEIQPSINSPCLQLFFRNGNKLKEIKTDYIIFAVGRRPELSFVSPSLLEKFETLKKQGKLYLAGDVINEQFRQATIAAGDGTRTAMAIYFNESIKKNK